MKYATRYRLHATGFMIFAFCLLPFTFYRNAYASVISDNKQGNRFYKEGKYGKALNEYKKAEGKKPSLAEIHYNIGNTFYQQKEYARASEEYGSALSFVKPKQGIFSSQVHYNIGNCEYRLENLQGAIDSYEKTLELNPQDKDAQHNIGFIKKLLKQKQKEKDKKDKENDKKSNKKNEKKDKKNCECGKKKEGNGKRETERKKKIKNRKERKKKKANKSNFLLTLMFYWIV